MAVAGDVILRPWREADLDSLVRYADNRNVWRTLRDIFPHPYTRADGEGWLAHCAAQPDPQLQFAIEFEGAAVGGIGFERRNEVYRFTAEIGYWLGEPFWGRGIMTEAVRRATAYGFQALGVERIEAHVFSSNPRSGRVLEKNGYTLEGRLRRSVFKDRQFLDALLYSRLQTG